jgi:hypothetical protein
MALVIMLCPSVLPEIGSSLEKLAAFAFKHSHCRAACEIEAYIWGQVGLWTTSNYWVVAGEYNSTESRRYSDPALGIHFVGMRQWHLGHSSLFSQMRYVALPFIPVLFEPWKDGFWFANKAPLLLLNLYIRMMHLFSWLEFPHSSYLRPIDTQGCNAGSWSIGGIVCIISSCGKKNAIGTFHVVLTLT